MYFLKAWSLNTDLFKPDQLQRLGYVVIGFKDDDLSKMDLSTDDVIYSLGSVRIETKEHVGYTKSQVRLRNNKSTFREFKIVLIKRLTNYKYVIDNYRIILCKAVLVSQLPFYVRYASDYVTHDNRDVFAREAMNH